MSLRLRLSALAAAFLALMAGGACADALSPAETAALTQPQALPDVVIGRADAPAMIVEYASLTCSHCAAFHKDVWPALKAKYVDTGKARFVLREFPIDGLAIVAFMLARCSGDDRRNAVVDRLFDHQGDWAFAANALAKLKDELTAAGMSEADFEACLKNQTLLDQVKAERDRAHGVLGVKATPTFFVGGQRLEGGQSIDAFDKILSLQAK